MWLLLINFLPDTFCKEPFCLWKFCWKMRFEASRAVFWSLSCYEELKLTIKPFTGLHFATFWSRCKILHVACKVRTCAESKISLSLLPSFFAFLASFFPFAGHLVGFILVGKVFRKAVRILGLDERKGRWVVEQDFHEDFQGNVTCFVLRFSSVLLTEMCSFRYAWKISSLCTS